eukprot:TRINITY_DN3912_c0_g1_i1.p2 TRINITY_DN3912_c0_g1~~TRINITY_DN3912_c0_g1_i1.p2  ORF type:complete len:116 (-),score=22.02 TRINITY_DN3912_c0_g1_i1:57-404(-)
MYAVMKNRTEICLTLLNNGAKPDIQASGSFAGQTALHLACSWGFSECAAILLTHGARTDIVGVNGKTPLDLAKEMERTECVDLIQQHVRRQVFRKLSLPHLSAALLLFNLFFFFF